MGDKEMVSGGGNVVIWQLTIYLPKRNQTLMEWEERRGKNIGVSGALKIKEEERNKKQTALSSAHLEWNPGRSNGWMGLKFYF